MSSGEVRTKNCREDSIKRHCLIMRRDSMSETARDRKTQDLRE